jgi:RNA polymerase sigma-70 factor (ECF subfamily)
VGNQARPSVEQFLRAMQPRVQRILAQFRVPPEDAEDVVQQALLALVYQWDEIRDPEAWLSGTIRHKCQLYWRGRKRRLYQAMDTVILEWVAGAGEDRQRQRDLKHDLDGLVSRLPQRCQELLRLRYRLGLEPAELAQELGYQRTSISKMTTRCLAALNREMVLAGFLSPPTEELAAEEELPERKLEH